MGLEPVAFRRDSAPTVFPRAAGRQKALKAVLSWHDEPFRKTHSIQELGRACTAIDPGLGDLIDAAVPLTEYAWKFRYGAPGRLHPPATRAGVARR